MVEMTQQIPKAVPVTTNGAVDQSIVAERTGNDECPGCGVTQSVQRTRGSSPRVQAWSCAACGLHWATTVVNPALPIVGLLPTPQLRTAAFLAALRAEVIRRSGKDSAP
jgi:ribosomal protein L37AE/L43A